MKVYKVILLLNILLGTIYIASAEKPWWGSDIYQNMEVEYFTFYSFLGERAYYDYTGINLVKNYGANGIHFKKIKTTVHDMLLLKEEVLKDCKGGNLSLISILMMEQYVAYLHAIWLALLEKYFHTKYNETQQKLEKAEQKITELEERLKLPKPAPKYTFNSISRNPS